MKAWWRRHRGKLLTAPIYGVARSIGRTLRLKVVGAERLAEIAEGKIISGWHGRSFIPANYFKGKGVWCMISHSKDGDMQTGIFKRFGFNVARGSTGRGGERAAIELIRVLRKGESFALTPDGPRGPAEVVQMGAVVMAKKSGAAMIPVGSHARPAWKVPTWDHYLVPMPFAKAKFVIGEPVYVVPDATDEQMEAARQELERRIKAVQAEAERL